MSRPHASNGPPSPEPSTDGRVVRGQRIRDATLRAMLDLIEAGNLRPTSAQIARRAHVSVRAIFNHFKDVETLRAAAIELQAREEARQLSPPILPELPLKDRIEAYVDQRCKFLETVTPFRRAAIVSEHFSPQVAEGLAGARARTRKQIEEVFDRELRAMPHKERAELLAMLVMTCSWSAWDTLRVTMRLSAAEARDVIAESLRRILGTPRSA